MKEDNSRANIDVTMWWIEGEIDLEWGAMIWWMDGRRFQSESRSDRGEFMKGVNVKFKGEFGKNTLIEHSIYNINLYIQIKSALRHDLNGKLNM